MGAATAPCAVAGGCAAGGVVEARRESGGQGRVCRRRAAVGGDAPPYALCG